MFSKIQIFSFFYITGTSAVTVVNAVLLQLRPELYQSIGTISACMFQRGPAINVNTHTSS